MATSCFVAAVAGVDAVAVVGAIGAALAITFAGAALVAIATS